MNIIRLGKHGFSNQPIRFKPSSNSPRPNHPLPAPCLFYCCEKMLEVFGLWGLFCTEIIRSKLYFVENLCIQTLEVPFISLSEIQTRPPTTSKTLSE